MFRWAMRVEAGGQGAAVRGELQREGGVRAWNPALSLTG